MFKSNKQTTFCGFTFQLSSIYGSVYHEPLEGPNRSSYHHNRGEGIRAVKR
jgi:hypothetical protein